MLSISDLKLGTVFKYEDQPFIIVKVNHSKQARGGAVLQTKIKNLILGQVLERNFKSADKFDEADVVRSKASFLYPESDNYYFMNSDTFEQFFLNQDQIGEQAKFLKEGQEVTVMYFENNPVSIELPVKIELKVISAPPGIKGDTAGTVTKQVTLETGAVINAPLFINEGDNIRVNTETEEYVERA